MSKGRYMLVAVAFAICAHLAFSIWKRWSQAEEIVRYYRSDCYKTYVKAAERSGVSVEVALTGCQDDG